MKICPNNSKWLSLIPSDKIQLNVGPCYGSFEKIKGFSHFIVLLPHTLYYFFKILPHTLYYPFFRNMLMLWSIQNKIFRIKWVI